VLPTQASAAFDTYLDLGAGYKGESTAVGFKDQIDVFSFSWGVSRSKDKPVSFSDLNLMKQQDQASPALMLAVANGTTIPTATLSLRRVGDSPLTFARYCMTGVQVTSLQHSGSAGGDVRPTESVSLKYSTIVMAYTRDSATGEQGTVFSAGWDLVRNLQFGQNSNC
jgi:type VI secretion system secreted protein Hcp